MCNGHLTNQINPVWGDRARMIFSFHVLKKSQKVFQSQAMEVDVGKLWKHRGCRGSGAGVFWLPHPRQEQSSD